MNCKNVIASTLYLCIRK